MLPAFFVEYRAALLFYAAVILLVILFRKRFTWQGIAGMYRTKLGLRLMERWGTKYRGLVQLLGIVGIGVGFVGMLLIMGILAKGALDLVLRPDAPPVVSPVIPGFKVFGHDLQIPLITGWIALFIVVVIHEFSHGVVSRAYNIKVKSSGFLLVGPLAGAFVEPDEKRLVKESPVVQYSLFAAGPFSNIITGVCFGLALAGLAALGLAMTAPSGVDIVSVVEGFPAAAAGVPVGALITGVNSAPIVSYDELTAALDAVGVGEAMTLETDRGAYTLVTVQHPDKPEQTTGYMGVTLQSRRTPVVPGALFSALFAFVTWLAGLFEWLVIFSFGLGLANLLPIGPVDGGRMFQTAARQVAGDTMRGDWWWRRVGVVTGGVVILLLVVPALNALF